MKIKLKYLICLLAVLLLTACGGTLRTNLSFNDSFSGSRTITYTVSNQDFTSYVSGNLSTIQSTLSTLCPEDMEITSVSQDNNNITAIFTVKFDSMDEYKKKIKNILTANGKDIEPEVIFIEPDSAFAKGVAYQENFSGEDLMSWMYDGIVDNGYVSSSYTAYIFSEKYAAITVNGKEFEGEGSMDIVDISAVEYLPIDGVEFATKINEDGTVNRSIKVLIPDSTYNEAEEEIKSFLDSRVKDVGSSEWSTQDNTHIFTITGESLNPVDCMTMTDNFTGSKSSFGMIDKNSEFYSGSEDSAGKTDEGIPDPEKLHNVIFYKAYLLNEKIDLKDYVSNTSNTVNFTYKVDAQSSYTGNAIDASGYNSLIEASEAESEEFVELFRGESSSFDFFINAQKSPTVSKYRHVVEITPSGNIKRNITVTFNNSFNENDAKVLEENLKKYYVSENIKLNRIELKGENLEVGLSSDANMADDIQMWEIASGYSRYSSSLSMDKKGILIPKQTIYFQDYFTPQIFTSRDIGSYEYRVKNIGKAFNGGIYNDYFTGSLYEGASGEFRGNDYVVEADNILPTDYNYVALVTVRTNILPYVIYVLFVLSILFLIFRIIMTILPKLSFNRKSVNATAESSTGSGEVFCSHCGARNEGGNKFCSSCGKEIN